jgi:hypothetical protein
MWASSGGPKIQPLDRIICYTCKGGFKGAGIGQSRSQFQKRIKKLDKKKYKVKNKNLFY